MSEKGRNRLDFVVCYQRLEEGGDDGTYILDFPSGATEITSFVASALL